MSGLLGPCWVVLPLSKIFCIDTSPFATKAGTQRAQTQYAYFFKKEIVSLSFVVNYFAVVQKEAK